MVPDLHDVHVPAPSRCGSIAIVAWVVLRLLVAVAMAVAVALHL